jgi:hypothetical protein
MTHYVIMRGDKLQELFWDADVTSLTHATSRVYTPDWSKTGTGYTNMPASVSARLSTLRAKDANSTVTAGQVTAYRLILRS